MNDIIDRIKELIFEDNEERIREYTRTNSGFTISDGLYKIEFIFDKMSDKDEYDYTMNVYHNIPDDNSEVAKLYTAYIKEDIAEIKLTFVYADRCDNSFLRDVFGFRDYYNDNNTKCNNTECNNTECNNETSMDESTVSSNLCDEVTVEVTYTDNVKRINIEIEYTNDIDLKALGEKIHNTLVGNKDYIESNILLNCDKPKELYLFRDNIHGDADGAKKFNEVLDIIKNA